MSQINRPNQHDAPALFKPIRRRYFLPQHRSHQPNPLQHRQQTFLPNNDKSCTRCNSIPVPRYNDLIKMKEFKLVLLYKIYSYSFVQVLSRKYLLLSNCMLENLSLKGVNIDANLKPFQLHILCNV